jgi:hypothetical protein
MKELLCVCVCVRVRARARLSVCLKFCCKLGKDFTEKFQLLNQAYKEGWEKGLLNQKKHG